MKYIGIILILFSLLNGLILQDIQNVNPNINYNPNAKMDTSKRSINAEAIGKIGKANIIIKYHSPGVRGRIIWGGLVPYNEVWVTGAHIATSIESDQDFIVDGISIPKGKYAFFTIPQKNEWTIILNGNYNQHLTDDYNEKEDIIRLNVKPEHSTQSLERLQYYIVDKKNNVGTITIGWERIKIHFDITIKE
jgi:hypothetical protein